MYRRSLVLLIVLALCVSGAGWAKRKVQDYSETIEYIVSSLEEREREAFVIQKMVKDRLARADEGSDPHG